MKKKALVTGVTGFAGGFLAEHLLSEDAYELHGTYLTEPSHKSDSLSLHQVDLTDKNAVDTLISHVKPDAIFHLAAFTSPADSFKDPKTAFTNNIVSQLNIFESLRTHNLMETKVLVVSSADIYGKVAQEDLPIDEQTPLNPTTPYAVSKIAQDFSGLQYYLSYGMPIVRVRPFNHVGPRQSPGFVIAAFAKQIAEIEKGKKEPKLAVGNLEPKRDFTDVRDIVRAYGLAIEQGKPGEVYNIGSGVSHAIKDILQMLLAQSSAKIEIQEDAALVRPVDNPELLCDCAKFQEQTGWKPEIPIEQTLKETLDYWREIV